MPYYPIKGFTPDGPMNSPGTLRPSQSGGWIPTLRGLRAAPGEETATGTFTSTCNAAVSILGDNNTARTFAATVGATNRIWEYNKSGKSWTNRTSAGAAGGNYALVSPGRWTFCSYNDTVYAVQIGEPLQASASGAFATVAAAAKATICANVLDFVFLFNTADSTTNTTYGTSPNRWWCCAAGDPTDWSANIATQCATGLLTDSPGAIVAARRLGSNMVAYKNYSMYIGRYIGAPLVWGWNLVPGSGLGTWGQYSVVDVEGIGHFFPGSDNFYQFDGSRATPIGNEVSNYFFSSVNPSVTDNIVGFHSRQQNNIYWHYTSVKAANPTDLDFYVVYNYRTGMWGGGTLSTQIRRQFFFEYLPDTPYDAPTAGQFDTNNELLPSYDKAFGQHGKFKNGVITAYEVGDGGDDNRLHRWEGTATLNVLRTNWYGTDDKFSFLDRFRPRFEHYDPADFTGQLVAYRTFILNDLGAESATITLQAAFSVQPIAGQFDTLQAGRWHQIELQITGDFEIMGFDVRLKEDSLE